MKSVKQLILRGVFALELVCFSWFYFFGYQGLTNVWLIEQENQEIEQRNTVLSVEIDALESDIQAWHTHPFFKEKIAREQLQMARQGDQIFYLQ